MVSEVMVNHYCLVEKSQMKIKQGCECNWCGKIEKPIKELNNEGAKHDS